MDSIQLKANIVNLKKYLVTIYCSRYYFLAAILIFLNSEVSSYSRKCKFFCDDWYPDGQYPTKKKSVPIFFVLD